MICWRNQLLATLWILYEGIAQTSKRNILISCFTAEASLCTTRTKLYVARSAQYGSEGEPALGGEKL